MAKNISKMYFYIIIRIYKFRTIFIESLASHSLVDKYRTRNKSPQ